VANILLLVHRLPYPPNKGDKVRSYHLLEHLAARHRVFLGTFVDDPDDLQHVPLLQQRCAAVHAQRMQPRLARAASLLALLDGRSLTEEVYRSRALQAWVDRVLRDEHIDAVVVFSSAMAQYVHGRATPPVLVDFVDVDSAKWTEYASAHAWPMSWLYRREGQRLLRFERQVAATARASFFVAPRETELFHRLAPEAAALPVETIGNGVDANVFSPSHDLPRPFPAGEQALVFTGAMDYWPNIDAVTWFAKDILPGLLARHAGLKFYIVGRSPSPAVAALAGPAVIVTGTVPDVRPYLAHANVVVAPLRLARGIQNKVLEAMAMARPVITTPACLEAIQARCGTEILAAADPGEFTAGIDQLLAEPARAEAIGQAARSRVLNTYSWSAHLSRLDHHLEGLGASTTQASGHALA